MKNFVGRIAGNTNLPIPETTKDHRIVDGKVAVQSVIIYRGEIGPLDNPMSLAYFDYNADTCPNPFAAAEKKISEWADGIRLWGNGGRGCLDLDFDVRYSDGEEYQGTYEVENHRETLQEHMINHLRFHTGESCPAHLTQAHYDNFMALCEKIKPTIKAECVHWLATYQIG